MSHISFMPDESRLVENVLTQLSEHAKYPITLEGLLKRWGSFVTQVESGYEFSIYDYTNDLSARDALEIVLGQVPQSAQAKLMPIIQPWDERFVQATQVSTRPLVPGIQEQAGFWWFRIPKKLGGELENDLRSDGIVR